MVQKEQAEGVSKSVKTEKLKHSEIQLRKN